MVANVDDKYGQTFLDTAGTASHPYSLSLAEPWNADDTVTSFSFKGIPIKSPLRGVFNIYNLLAAATFTYAIGVDIRVIDKAIGELHMIRGRVEYVRLPDEHPKRELQRFDAIVDYAHTVESLTELYKAFPSHKKLCVLGNTGGGRDKWKRKEMGTVADKYCDEVILTNEDPYDENPMEILKPMKEAVKNKPCEIILDRRGAITSAMKRAYSLVDPNIQNKVAVLITVKGTDPYIMGPNGTKQEWDDAEIVRQELSKVLADKQEKN